MDKKELSHIIASIVILTAVFSFGFILINKPYEIPKAALYSTVLIILVIGSKKLMASMLDLDIEHQIWMFSRWGFRKQNKFKKEAPAGIIFPLLLSLISLGAVKFSALLTYEARALKYRAAKRFGYYSYAEMTDWHNALIGTAGIMTALIISVVSYFLPYDLELLARMSAYYAFWNLLPISNLDGTQIFFGSKILWSTLAILTLIITAYALIIGFGVI